MKPISDIFFDIQYLGMVAQSNTLLLKGAEITEIFLDISYIWERWFRDTFLYIFGNGGADIP